MSESVDVDALFEKWLKKACKGKKDYQIPDRQDAFIAGYRAAQSAPVEGDKPIEDCPHCDNDGYTVEQDGFGNPVQAQCEFCYTNPNSRFNRTQPNPKQGEEG